MNGRVGVVVLTGPSGSGKSRVAERSGLPVVRLDDFYREAGDPGLPTIVFGEDEVVDWDDLRSWDAQAACDALETLCTVGTVDVPVYDISLSRRTGSHTLTLGDATTVVAEGLFAHAVVAELERRGLLRDALCVRHHRLVTFVLRLVRDLREKRKSLPVLLHRGWYLMREEPAVVALAREHGCRPMTPRQAERRIRALAGFSGANAAS
ncbi:uridine kinase family protein [Mumia zhuanghuii]|uniref:ATP-binding protein n=1 Tax=Mumia zhuanghuii TaxID=2585211 RepID=A0A5C4MJV7_9ACTN|nr:ATP-binding protein [Mumia zhuanghuii]TNC32423.1 ATP-binding protein [Mumia zhuanghuii]TNC44957.1 ATP-binding protein [Mumia zhuanghuii]